MSKPIPRFCPHCGAHLTLTKFGPDCVNGSCPLQAPDVSTSATERKGSRGYGERQGFNSTGGPVGGGNEAEEVGTKPRSSGATPAPSASAISSVEYCYKHGPIKRKAICRKCGDQAPKEMKDV